MVRFINFMKGYVRIKVWGVSAERFMNLCANKNLLIWDVIKKEDGYEMYMSLPAFYEIRPLARKTSTRAVVLKRYGLPFMLPGLRKRVAFTVCCISVIVFWFASSLFLWDIEFEGNYKLTDEMLLDFLEEHEVRVGILKNTLDIELLEKEIRREFTDVTWTSMKLEGSRLMVSVKENDAPIIESSEQESVAETGVDIVTPYEGTIREMIVRKGVPQVKIGDGVTVDTILVEGKVPVLNEDSTVREYLYVESDADIMLEHVIDYEESLAVSYTRKIYTGREKEGGFLRWGDHELTLDRKKPYLLYDVVTRVEQPGLFEILKIPFYTGSYQYREYYIREEKYTEEQAEELLSGKLSEFLKALQEKGVQIIEKDVKISGNEDSWICSGNLTIVEKIETRRPTVTENITDIGE